LYAMAFAVSIAYYGRFLPTSPVSDGTPKKCDRNAEIRARHQQGESVATLAGVFGISEQRVSQILRGQRR
jgi:Mor family transcriptional regulator